MTAAPTILGRGRSIPVLLGIATNPISTMRRLHAEHGAFVILHYPNSRTAKPQILACLADAALYQTVASNTAAWRTVNVGILIPRKHAATRLARSVTRLQGVEHTHYRRLLSLPLSKQAVANFGPGMAEIAKRDVALWPRRRRVNLSRLASSLMQDFAISLLFGDDRDHALPIAEMISDAVAAAWPFPGPAYFKWLRTAPKLERAIHKWADEKERDLDPKDMFSVLINNPDVWGGQPDKEIISGILTFTFGAAYDTCQNALAWTMVLLAQHPQIAAQLIDEIDHAVGDEAPTMERIGALPLLDGVVREGMRLFPPVPIQFRRSQIATELGTASIPAGMRVLNSAFLINRDPELYAEPSSFKPERWRDLTRSAYEGPVFGAGARMCPGSLFGNQMVKIALAAILSSHTVELAPRARIDYRSAITMRPFPGVPVILREKTAVPRQTTITGTIRELVDLPV